MNKNRRLLCFTLLVEKAEPRPLRRPVPRSVPSQKCSWRTNITRFFFCLFFTASHASPPVYLLLLLFFFSSFTTGVWIVSSHFAFLSRCCTYVSVSGCGTILSSARGRKYGFPAGEPGNRQRTNETDLQRRIQQLFFTEAVEWFFFFKTHTHAYRRLLFALFLH